MITILIAGFLKGLGVQHPFALLGADDPFVPFWLQKGPPR